jgi:hypothetical protein
MSSTCCTMFLIIHCRINKKHMIKLKMKWFEDICDTGIRGSSVLNVSDTIDASLFVSANIAIENVPYRIPSHSATSLYNLRQFKPISDQFTSIVYVVPASNLRTGVVWPRVILCHFHILASKISWLSINMETYPHLVSSQIPHIYYFIIYLYSKTIIVLCNILNSQIAGNIFVSEQCHRKLMFSRDFELNPGPAFLY